jgi:hypothetical protein
MYRAWHIRKAAVKLLIGLSVILALVESDITTGEKSAQASNQGGVSFLSLLQSSREKNAVFPPVQTDSPKVPKGTAKISDSGPEPSPTPEAIWAKGESERPHKSKAGDDQSKPTIYIAQLQQTDPNPEEPGESPAQSREIIPLRVQPPIRRGPAGYTSRYFHVARPQLGLGLSYDYEDERRGEPGSQTRDRSNEFRQKLELEADGWVYHPALFTYTLRFNPEWIQTLRESDPGENSTSTSFQPFYAIDGFFLEPKPYTLHGFAERREIRLRSAFTQVSDTTIDTYGGDLRLKYEILPTFFKYSHTDTDQSGFYDSTGKRDDFRLSSSKSTSNTTTNLSALYTDNEQTSGGAKTGAKTFNGDLGNDFNIAGNKRKRLHSSLSYRWSETNPSEGSSSETSFFNIREDLFWRHTPKMYSNYFFAYQKSDTEGFDRDSTTLRAKVQHLLYENLTTTAAAGANLNDTTAGNENIYDGDLNLLYQRTIPWGTLSLSANFDYIYTDRSGFDESVIQVTNEPHVLTTGVVTLLDNEDVSTGTIVVTDVTGTIVYAVNVDYTIGQVGNFTSISRTTTGAIANGQTVLVDYQYTSDPTFDDTIFNQAYRIQFYLWDALTLGYGFQHANQHIVSGPHPDNPIDDTRHTAEIRLNLGWTDTRLTFEDTDRSSGTSLTRWTASQTFRLRPMRRFLVDVTGSYGSTDFKDTNQTQDQYGMSGRLFWTPTGWCRFRAEGFWNKVSGDLQDNTTDANLTVGVEFSYRIWSGGIFYYYDYSKVGESSRKRQAARVEIIRILW